MPDRKGKRESSGECEFKVRTVTTPAVVVAAPASGSGKTTVATGLVGALRRVGLQVAPFKVGPDFIDPGYHSLAARRPGRNLDTVLTSPGQIGPLYLHGCAGADIAVVEGVMGLFDGRVGPPTANTTEGSTAQVAGLLSAPVILVVDASGHSHSLAALLHGFATFDARTKLAGVILNRVGSPRHEEILRQACQHVGLPVLGAIPRDDALAVPSRHLGLVTAVEHGKHARSAIAAMEALVSRHVNITAVAALAAAHVTSRPWNPSNEIGEQVNGRPVIAVAAGRAFSFSYAEHHDLLRAAGAEVVEFDPITDLLPANSAGLILPGGFPEQYPEQLADNSALREQIRAQADTLPIHAECAGLTFLMDELDGHPMCGVLAGRARFTPRLTLGYREASALSESTVHPAGHRATGHEFHRTTVDFAASYQPAWAFSVRGETVLDGVIHNQVHAAYLHTHPAGQPQSVQRFVMHAAKVATPASGLER